MELVGTRLQVSDIAESLDFFCHKLGLIELGRRELDPGASILILLTTPEEFGRAREGDAAVLELAWRRDGGPVNARDRGHVAFQIEDLYTLCHHLVHAGVDLDRPPRDGRRARVHSPDGHAIELRQQGEPREPMEPWISMPDRVAPA